MRKILQQIGFTLIETMIAVSIMAIVVVIGADYVINGFRATTFASEQETAIEHARRAIETMSKEIRGANSSDEGDYPLKTIDDYDLEFYSDINYDGQTDKVRYFQNGRNLVKVVTQPGPAHDYTVNSATTTIAEYLNNDELKIFEYYDNNYNETNDIDEIRLVKIRLKINVTPERAPLDYYVETDVHLRNLKDNL